MKKDIEETKAKLNKLKAKFVDGLAGKFGNIEKIINEVALQGDNIESLKELYVNVHNICGTSGVFGFLDLSDTASGFEKELKKYTEGGEALDESGLGSLNSHFDKLNMEFEKLK